MKRVSKFISLLLVMIMLFMLVPLSAFAATEEETVVTADNQLKLVLLTSDVKAAETAESEPTVPEKTASEADIAGQATTDAKVVPSDKTAATVAPEQQATVAASDPVELKTAKTEAVDLQTATYLCLTQNGVIIDVIAANTGADYDYDASANELTLNNFVGEKLDVKSTAIPFKLILLGTNILKTDNGFAVRVEGDMNASGTGTLVAEGVATPEIMGGGINVIGNLVIDSGNYDISSVGYENSSSADSSSAVGILAGDNAEVMTMGNITINGGNIDVTAYNSDIGGAFGLFAFGNLIVNDGNINVLTDSPVSYSRGIGAYDNLVFNGGNTIVESIADHGDAAALFSYNKISINNGILDLCTSGDISKAILATGSIEISPIYGDVDRDATCLYLEPLSSKTSSKTFNKQHVGSSNPKTGVDTSERNAIEAGFALLSLIGLAYAVRKREANA